MGTEQSQQLKSILLINDYHILCKLRNPNCAKTKLVRKFLCQKISKILDKSQTKKFSLLSFLF
jgi:hypothetical protein